MQKEDQTEILLDYVRENYSHRLSDDQPLSADTHLFREGIIDSIGVLMLVQFVEKRFALKIEADEMILDNFSSVARMNRLIREKQVSD